MGPKTKSNKKQKPEPEEAKPEEIPEPTPEPVEVDPYNGLRYYPYQIPEQPVRPYPKTRKIPVLKKIPRQSVQLKAVASNAKTRSSALLSDVAADKKKPRKKSMFMYIKSKMKSSMSIKALKPEFEDDCYTLLNIKAAFPEPMPTYVSPGELPITPPPLEVLHNPAPVGFTELLQRENNLTREKRSLRLYKKEKLKQFEMENYLMQNTGKERGSLLIRKKQLLPKIEENGTETAIMKEERTETPAETPVLALFDEAKRNAHIKNGLRVTMTRRERGYNLITDWLGCPEVTDLILQKLGLATRSLYLAPKSEADLTTEHFIPKIESLGVVGSNYDDTQKHFREIKSIKEGTHHEPRVQIVADEPQTDESKRQTVINSSASLRYQLQTDDSTDPRVSLIFGDRMLAWSTDPEKAKQRWIIEMGCTAELGKNSVGCITMRNTGTTAIHFNWVKYPQEDTFQLHRCDLERFVFDCWGGVILPNETLRVPFLYKSLEPGYYSQDWRLLTKPVLENNAHVIVRLWGITRQYDPYFRAREIIDEKLAIQMIKSVAKHRVDKIIDYLPLKEVPLEDTRFPLIHLGPDLFHENNPWLKYRFVPVYKLGKLAKIIQVRKEKREALISLLSSEAISSSESDGLSEGISPGSLNRFSQNQWLDADIEFMGDEEEDDRHNEIPSDVELVRDEFSVSHLTGTLSDRINYLIEILRKKISPNVHAIKQPVYPNPIKNRTSRSSGQHSPTSSQAMIRKHPKAPINLVNPDFVVAEMRKDILEDNETLEMQEAMFTVLTDEVSKLVFRRDVPLENWKLTIGRTLLCNAMDNFSDFAQFLHLKCCQGQEMEELKEEMAAEQARLAAMIKSFSTVTESDFTEELPPVETVSTKQSLSVKQSINQNKSNSTPPSEEEHNPVDETALPSVAELISKDTTPPADTPVPGCQDLNPRLGLRPTRYQDECYTGLHMKMYQLLSDFVDSLDHLFEEKKELRLNYDELGFTRIDKVPMHVSVEGILKAPLPPKWVKVAQKMETTRTAIRDRKEEVEEIWLQHLQEKGSDSHSLSGKSQKKQLNERE